MRSDRRSVLAGVSTFLASAIAPSALVFSLGARAQAFPAKPVKIVVTFAAGGGADVVLRVMQQKLQEVLGQPVIIDNRVGAGGNIGTEYVAKSPADGYTLLVATASQATNTTLSKGISWDLVKDFVPVIGIGQNQSLLVVHPSVPATNVTELIAYAKANPNKLSYASYGSGSSAHMSAELFKMMSGTQMLHVPYKGAAPAINDVIAGQVNLIFADVAAVLPFAKAGSARALGLGSPTRFAGLPNVPTITDSGLPGFETGGFLAIVAPAGTPRPVVDALNTAFAKTLADPEVKARMEGLACPPMGGTPERLGTFMRGEIDKWARVIKVANIMSE